jgi:hypothetical protein
MANDNSTHPDPDPVPVEAAYFERPQGSPPVLDLIIALDGVCSALNAEQINFEDHDQIERIGGMGTAAHILASQLWHRYYAQTKPLSKRTLEKRRRQQAEWLAAHDAMRDRLAGPAKELLRAAYAPAGPAAGVS